MRAFNVLVEERSCPNCGVLVTLEIQFKYGDTSQYRYRIGDAVRWGGNDIGRDGFPLVVASGIAECPRCGVDTDFDVWIRANRLERADVDRGAFEYFPESFVVLEPEEG